jgi:hypothetical protein
VTNATEQAAPFREEDLEARLRVLGEERDRLRGELAGLRREIAALRPWKWSLFLLGVVLGVAIAFVGIMALAVR